MRAKTLDKKLPKFDQDRLYFNRHRLSNENYHMVKQAVSSSALKELYNRKNPFYCYQKYVKRAIESKPTPAMEFGTAVHTMVLEPYMFGKRYAVWDGGVRRGKAWDAFKDDNMGKSIITVADFEKIKDINNSVKSHPKARELLKGGEAEKSVFWRDELTGVMCKARCDYIKQIGDQRVIIDLKTCKSAEAEQFTKDAVNLGYPIQQAMYMDGFKADAMCFICIEKDELNTVAVHKFDSELAECGNLVYRQMMEQWAQCLNSKHWPSYAEGITELHCPAWYANKILGA